MPRNYSGKLLGDYCSWCGSKMREKIGGLSHNLLMWECSSWSARLLLSFDHDMFYIGEVKAKPRYDTMTGEKIDA